MSGFRQPETPREQLVLWEQKLDDALPLDHQVRCLDLLLRSSAFRRTFRDWEQAYVLLDGRPPYHPRYMAGLYIYGQLVGLRSSRKLENACCNRLDVIWLMEGQKPDHSTIAEFFKGHQKSLRKLFRDTLWAAAQAELIDFKHLGVDGTKIAANASVSSVKKQERIEDQLRQLDDTIAKLEREWEENERQENALFCEADSWQRSKPKSLDQLKAQQQRLMKALEVLERRVGEGTKKEIVRINSTTDPESRNTKDKSGKCRPCYNAQLGVDESSGLITAAKIIDAAGDEGQLMAMVHESEGNCGQRHQSVSADSQYNTGQDLKEAEQSDVTTYLPDQGTRGIESDPIIEEAQQALRTQQTLTDEQVKQLSALGRGKFPKALFEYDAVKDKYRCPRMESLKPGSKDYVKRKGGVVLRTRYSGAPCATCPWRKACCGNAKQGRTIIRDNYESYRQRLRERMQTEEAQQIYQKRSHVVETPFGHFKRNWSFSSFLHRGRQAAETEWILVCAANNFMKLLKNWAHIKTALKLVG